MLSGFGHNKFDRMAFIFYQRHERRISCIEKSLKKPLPLNLQPSLKDGFFCVDELYGINNDN